MIDGGLAEKVIVVELRDGEGNALYTTLDIAYMKCHI